MFGIMGDPPKRAGTLMPPATTRRLPERPAASTRDARIAPPFVPGSPHPQPPHETEVQAQSFVEPAEDEAFVASAEDEAPAESDVEAEPDIEPWEAMADGEGVVEPAFQADTDAVLLELAQHASEVSRKEEFPLDAFIVPEEAQHVPSGLEGSPATAPPENTPANSLAERLEKLSHRLRVEESDAIVRRLAGGDRLDALLAGLLAGYLAGKSERP